MAEVALMGERRVVIAAQCETRCDKQFPLKGSQLVSVVPRMATGGLGPAIILVVALLTLSLPMPEAMTGLRFASALSEAADTASAVSYVVDHLSRELSGPADLVVVFATSHHRENFRMIHDHLATALAPRVELGVTAGGVVGVRQEVESAPGLSVLAAHIPGAVLRPFCYENIDWPEVLEDREVLREQTQTQDMDLRAVLVLADPFSTPMVNLLPTFNEAWAGVPVVGGMASGANRPGGNRLLIDGQIHREGAVGVAIGGDLRVNTTVSQGCRPIGQPYVITRSKRHIVQELGGQNALESLQEMDQDLAVEDRELLRSQPLLVGRVINEYKARFGRGDFLIRSVVDIDEDEGYLVIGDAQVRVGQTIQFHVRDQRTAQEDFALLLEGQKLYGSPSGALLFSCNGRGTNLFDHPHADATMVNNALGEVPLAGFFAAGEIGPVGDQNFLHGHTASLLLFRSAEGDTFDA